MGDNINWVPVDKLAVIILELLRHTPISDGEGGGDLVVYNIVNSQHTSWQNLLPALDGIVPKRVPLCEWIAAVEGGRDHLDSLHRNPALRLIDFYKQTLLVGEAVEARSGLAIDSNNMLEASDTARGLGPITKDDMASWVEHWGL
jgi:hypothetical protein